jgi:hypothetical protein
MRDVVIEIFLFFKAYLFFRLSPFLSRHHLSTSLLNSSLSHHLPRPQPFPHLN